MALVVWVTEDGEEEEGCELRLKVLDGVALNKPKRYRRGMEGVNCNYNNDSNTEVRFKEF